MKVAQNEKPKRLLGFSLYINIGNFEAFLWNLNLSAKHLFWTCEAPLCIFQVPAKLLEGSMLEKTGKKGNWYVAF